MIPIIVFRTKRRGKAGGFSKDKQHGIQVGVWGRIAPSMVGGISTSIFIL